MFVGFLYITSTIMYVLVIMVGYLLQSFVSVYFVSLVIDFSYS